MSKPAFGPFRSAINVLFGCHRRAWLSQTASGSAAIVYVPQKRESESSHEWQGKIPPMRNGCSLLAADRVGHDDGHFSKGHQGYRALCSASTADARRLAQGTSRMGSAQWR